MIRNILRKWLGIGEPVKLQLEEIDEQQLRQRINKALKELLTEEYVMESVGFQKNLESALRRYKCNADTEVIMALKERVSREDFIDSVISKINKKQLT
jgi:hypothetical protein